MTRIFIILLSLQLVVLLTAKYSFYLQQQPKYHAGHKHRGPKIYDTECTKEAYEQFQKDNNRTPDEHDEERRARLCEVIKMNQQRRSRRHSGDYPTYEEGVTSISDLSPEEYRRLLGFKHVEKDIKRSAPLIDETEQTSESTPNDLAITTEAATVVPHQTTETPASGQPPNTYANTIQSETTEEQTKSVTESAASATTTEPTTVVSQQTTEEPTSEELTANPNTDAPHSTDAASIHSQTTEEQTESATESAATTTIETTTTTEVPLPTEFDWRDYLFVSPVKDQNPCGSCWAFAAVAAIESAVALKDGTPGNFTILSEQHLVDCSVPIGHNGCNGSDPMRALQYAVDHRGINFEEHYPYVNNRNEDKHQCNVSGNSRGGISNKAPRMLEANNEESLKRDLVDLGPIVISYDARSLQHYFEGVHYDPECGNQIYNLSHAMLLVGYGTDPVKGDYWTVKNSWGKWGEDGYLRTARNKDNNCGIATYPIIPVF